MTQEPNEAVLALWREQTSFLTQVPEFVTRYVDDIGGHLGTLYQQAEERQDQDALQRIRVTWEHVNALKATIDNQQQIASNAGVIVAALKVQRDELAAELQNLLSTIGAQLQQGDPLTGFIERLYEDWLDTLDTDEIEEDAQDELLDWIADEINGAWHVPAGLPVRRVLSAIRGHLQLDDEQRALFQGFLNSLG